MLFRSVSQSRYTQAEIWKTEEKRKKHNEMYAVAYNSDMFNIVKECAALKMTIDETVEVINATDGVLDTWKLLNKDKRLSPYHAPGGIPTINSSSAIPYQSALSARHAFYSIFGQRTWVDRWYRLGPQAGFNLKLKGAKRALCIHFDTLDIPIGDFDTKHSN